MAYPFNLGEILSYMGYEDGTDFVVVDLLDGNGPTIETWNHGDTQPSETDVTNFYASYQASPDRLTEKKTRAKLRIDQAAERARLRHVTDGAAQAMVYLQKGNEADAFITAGYPADLTGYPFIQAEMNASGQTKEQAADAIKTKRDAWVTLGANIEEERLGGKKNVENATDESGVNSARDAAILALDGI